MRYSLFAGGKRFRPLLCLATARALGKPAKKVLPVACAIEMIHTFTLIHDDLPGMDNSDRRRGKLTCHKKFNEATAILAGDALNTLAFDVLARETGNSEIISEVGRALMEVVEGQVLDLESEGKRIGLARLKAIHQLKTAALLRACVRASALELNANKKQLKALSGFAGHIGLAFQIADDILDATGTAKELGKPVKADKSKGFPFIIGLARSRSMAEAEKQAALKCLQPFGKKAKILRQITEFVVARKK
ncbi:MAG: polyprenyl synthetase family protein [Candidatus Saganbacteria bacterium]|nr:polyprenyl synthetase family protein [Candidatus Saganbacteria bacterium]